MLTRREAPSAYGPARAGSTEGGAARGAGPAIAVLGAGLMGRWHLQAARRLGARLLAVADPDTARARALAGPDLPVFPGLDEMLRAVRPDVLHLCSPTASHGPAIEAAIARGVHVFAEKPLAADAAQTRRLADLARAAGLRLCPVHQYAFQDAVERVIAGRDRAGALRLVDLDFFSAGAAAADLPGIAADILPHPAAIVQRLWPDRPLGSLDWTIRAAGQGGWQIAAPLEGALVRITLSLTARPTRAALTLWGERGAWEAELFHGYARFRDGTATRRSKMLRPFADAAGQGGHAAVNLAGRALRREPAYPGLRALTAAFYASLSGGAEPIPPDRAVAVAELRDLFLARIAGGAAR